MYEAVTLASNRVLYGTVVTDFTHVGGCSPMPTCGWSR